MATLDAPTLEDVAEGVGVGSAAQTTFKQYLAQFVSDDAESINDEESEDHEPFDSEPRSGQELQSLERDGSSEQDVAVTPTTGNTNGGKRKATSDDEEDYEEYKAPKRSRVPRPGKQLDAPLQNETVAWRDFAKEFKLSKRTGDPKTVPLPPSRALHKKKKYTKKQLAFHRMGTGLIIKRPFRDLVMSTIAKQLKEASKVKPKQRKNAKERCDAKYDHLLLKDSAQEMEGDSSRPRVVRKGRRQEKNISYVDDLQRLSKEALTQEQKARLVSIRLRDAGRTVSSGRGDRYAARMTNGCTAQDVFMPSADTWEEFRSHARLTDLNQGESILMTGQHLAWDDCRHDEFLSYSEDLLFLLVHALNRFHTGQTGVTIQYINCEKATTPDG